MSEDDLFSLQETIRAALSGHGQVLSSFSFVAIFCWQDFFRFQVRNVAGRTCVFAENEAGVFLYLPPLGGGSLAAAVAGCLDILAERNHGSGVSRIENCPVRMKADLPDPGYEWYLRGYEPLYFRKDLAALSGQAYKSRRAEVNQFCRNNHYQYEPYDPGMFEECLALYARWAADRAERDNDDIYRQMLTENAAVHRRALQYHEQLGLLGRVARVGGRIRAYTFAYPVSPRVLTVLSEITDPTVRGLPAFICRALAADPAVRDFDFFNTMDDQELPRVAASKRTYRPGLLAPVYTLTRKER